MRKIRQHNDIDIVVKLKNDEGAVLDATLIKEYKVFLTQVGYRLRIEDYQILPDGRIGFRFHAANQRVGVYSIVVTAVTTDDRVFTTDVCNAFALVRCSCDAEDGSSDAEIEALEVNATFEITAWGGGGDSGDSGGEIQTSLKYYDDGSGEVVPVKHPDLSTQPSILPYKFAGSYVYEQMVWVDGSRFTGDVQEIDLIRFKDYNLEGKHNIIIDQHSFIVGDTFYGNYTPSANNSWYNFVMVSDAERIFIRRTGSTLPVCKGVWVRVVWTTEPKAGEYYYYQQGGNEGVTLTLESGDSTIASFPMTLEIDGREFDWRDNGGNISLYGDLLDRFLSGKAAIIVKRGTNYYGPITFYNERTNESGNMFVYPGDTFDLNYLASLAYNTYSNLMRGVSQKLTLAL